MDKKILVTGGCGFIGSEVVHQLVERGYSVTVVDDLSKPESAQKEGYEFVRADLTDPAAAERVFAGHERVIHLAAKIGGIGYFHKYPATILADNNQMYSAVFGAAVKQKVKRFLYVSSSMVFESTDRFPSKESDLLEIPPPVTAYGFSKLSGEWYCRAFHDQYGLEYTICRPFNAYGPFEAPGDEVGYAHVIPDLAKKILDGQNPLKLLGDGRQTRCFTHVRDIASGIVAALEHEAAANQDFNISHPKEMAIRDLAAEIWKYMKPNEILNIEYEKGFVHDIKRRIPATEKAKQVIGWEAKIGLETGLPEVIDWIKANYKPNV